jgi:hypothetical protein
MARGSLETGVQSLISYLELENYRGFERFRLSGLARVNLLVGRNNSGKTSILEAVNLLDAAEDPSVLGRIALDRGEVVPASSESAGTEDYANVFHLFYGHKPRPGTIITLGTNQGNTSFKLDLGVQNGFERPRKFGDSVRLIYSLSVSSMDVPPNAQSLPHLVSEDGALLTVPLLRLRGAGWHRNGVVQFISAGSLGTASMNAMWDRVNIEGRKDEVIEAMRILEPTLTDIFFLTSGGTARSDGRHGILSAFEGRTQLVPLGSQGEGMTRLLALSLALVCAREGTLLIDEIDTGLHYSIMGDLWLMVVATTHSSDCVRGLAWLCENRPDLGEDVSIQKIDPSLEESVALDSAKIRIAAEQDIEVR